MVEIYLKGSWVEIPSNELESAINYDARIDEVFDSGTFSFVSKTIDYNIPPLTLCRIDGKLWFCSSESNEVIPSNPKEYNHDVSLMELTYITTCYILGTKVFSNIAAYSSDNAKIQAIVDIINDKYSKLFSDTNYKFTAVELENASSREYNFGAGTTMFQALLEISKSANAIPRISSYNEDTKTFTIEWDYLANGTAFSLDESKILENKMFQNTDQYVSKLETEIESVEDNNLTKIKNLTIRSQEFIINSDNQILITPTRIKEIKSFRTSGTAYGKKVIAGFYEHIDVDKATALVGKTQNMINFLEIFTDRTYYDAVQYLAGSAYTLVKLETTSQFVVDGQANTYLEDVDITDRILEKNQYDLLEATEQPKYCYYTYNSNLIEGMYKFYNNDFWGTVFMQTVYPFLHYAFENKIGTVNEQIDDRYGTTVVAATMIEGFVDYNPINYSFNIDYIPITSCFVNSSIQKNPFNETQIKPVVRSFDINTSLVDYDQLKDAINKNSRMMGMPEITISYDGKDYPTPGQKIQIKEQTYYVSSVQTTIALENYTSYINLVSDYSKIAEVYGVKTQFESTRLPLTGVVDRIVYCGEFRSTKTPTGALITINSTGQKLYKRGVLFSKDYQEIFVVEANDNYCFDTAMSSNDNLIGGNYENKQYTYADENNEQETYTVQLVNENDLTIEESKALPIIADDKYTANYFNEIKEVIVHKDSRERLIFSFNLYGKTSGGETDPEEPTEGYTFNINYSTSLESPNGVRVAYYNGSTQLGYVDLNKDSNSATINNANRLQFVITGAGHKVNVGTTLGGTDIINNQYPNSLNPITFESGKNIYIEEVN